MYITINYHYCFTFKLLSSCAVLVVVHSHVHLFIILSFSTTRQLRFTAPRQNELTTLKDCVLSRNSWTVGLSLVAPRCRWQPKKFSSGSWHNV